MSDPVQIGIPARLSAAGVAKVFGVNPATVTQWKKNGIIACIPGTREFDALEVIQAIYKYHRNEERAARARDGWKKKPATDQEQSQPAGTLDIADDATIEEARRVKELAAARQGVIALRKEEGRLVDKDKVSAQVFETFRSLRDRCLLIPDRVKDLCAGQPADFIKVKILDEIKKALTEPTL